MKYCIERIDSFTDDVLMEIQSLFAACYGEVPLELGGKFPSLEELRWRYVEPPLGACVWVARYKGDIIGLRPSVRKKIRFGERDYHAFQFMDAMTHPGFRNKGVYTSLLRTSTSDLARLCGVDVIYAFPNSASLPIYSRLSQWKYIGDMTLFVKPLVWWRRKPLTESIKGSNVEIKRIGKFDDVVCSGQGHGGLAFVIRSRDYLNWRYVRRPGVEYNIYAAYVNGRLSGYIVLRLRRLYGLCVGIIVEFLVMERDLLIARELVSRAVEWFGSAGANIVIFAVSVAEHDYIRLLSDFGFYKISSCLLPRKLAVVVNIVGSELEVSESLLNIRGWFLMLGDNDAV